ncbi:MAG: DUF58 domain-containing protein [Spirochaetales bacterium]|nr:DUF58 domain-containing protein [Spirochaetales bacterium]
MDDIFLDSEFLKKLEYLAFLAKRIRKGSMRGEHYTYRKGSSLDFRDHRSYNAGDDFRYIDWNVYSRLKKIFVKLFAAEEDLPINILVDTSLSMTDSKYDKLSYAKKLAAALAYIGLTNLERVGIVAFRDRLCDFLPAIRRKTQSFSMFSFLSGLQSEGTTEINRSLSGFSAKTGRPGLIIIISDFMDPGGIREGALSLLYNKHDVILLHILTEDELFPGYSGNLILTDSENGETCNINIDKYMLNMYQKELQKFFKELEDFSLQHGMEYMRTSTSIPFDEVILKYLRQGMHLH